MPNITLRSSNTPSTKPVATISPSTKTIVIQYEPTLRSKKTKIRISTFANTQGVKMVAPIRFLVVSG